MGRTLTPAPRPPWDKEDEESNTPHKAELPIRALITLAATIALLFYGVILFSF